MAQHEDDIHIPIDEDDSADSAFGDDAFSDTTSIASTIYRHRYEHGRRYHKFREGEYWGPNDDLQNDGLDIAHHMLRIMLDDKLYLAPIVNPQCVLDVGTGTGIWAIDFADDHPSAEVIGIDLSPIQPEFVPPNCKFEVDDCCSPWTFPLEHFDMIHIRCLFGSVADWRMLYQEVYDHLQPGGWINQLEMDIRFMSDDSTCGPDHFLAKWGETFIEAGEIFGKTFKIPQMAKDLVIETGFQNVQQLWYKLPVGGWSSDPKLKELGRWNFLHCYQGAEGWALFLLTRVLNWSLDEAKIYIAEFKNAIREKGTHAYFQVCVVYGQKPRRREEEEHEYHPAPNPPPAAVPDPFGPFPSAGPWPTSGPHPEPSPPKPSESSEPARPPETQQPSPSFELSGPPASQQPFGSSETSGPPASQQPLELAESSAAAAAQQSSRSPEPPVS